MPTKKLKYGAEHMPAVKPTFFVTGSPRPLSRWEQKRRAMRKPQQPLQKQKHYEAGTDDSGESTSLDEVTISLLLKAIFNTDEMQFIRKLMAEQNNDAAGGEVAAEEPVGVDPQATYEEKREAYQRAGRDDGETLHYQQPKPIGPAERYARRQQAHTEAAVAFDHFLDSRKEISERAAEYALANGCSYDAALRGIGESMPDVKLIAAVPV